MESKHLAGRLALPGGVLPPVQPVSQSPLTATSGPSLPPAPLRLPPPRPSVQDAERVVCSTSTLVSLPERVLQAGHGRSPQGKRVIEPIAPALLPRVLGAMFGGPCANAEPHTLCDLASARAGRLDEAQTRHLVDQVATLSRNLSSVQLHALLIGLAGALPADERVRCRDHLLTRLLDRDAGFAARDLARLTLAATVAWGGDAMLHEDFKAFTAVLAQAPGVHDKELACALVDGLCEGLSLDEGATVPMVEALVQALCQGVGLLEDPMDAELLMRRLAAATGGPRMGLAMRARLVDALLDEPDLPVEQLGLMLLGLAVALEGPARARSLATGPRTPPLMTASLDRKDGKSRKIATAGELAAIAPTLPSLSGLLAASLELSEVQLARWGQAVGVALRPEGEEGLAEIEQALRESGRLLDTGRLTALACGLGAGLADGCPDGRTRLALDLVQAMPLGLPEASQREAVRRGFHLALDPLAATTGREDRLAWLQAAWQLPGVLNARTAPLWFAQALALQEPAAERARVLATLVVHGAAHLEDEALRQARDLALSADASVVPAIYGAWIESGLPPGLFDETRPPAAELRIERLLMARRLAVVKEELAGLPALGCDAHLRMRLRGLLVGWRKDLQRGLEAATKDTKAGFSASPAAR